MSTKQIFPSSVSAENLQFELDNKVKVKSTEYSRQNIHQYIKYFFAIF